DRREPLLEVRPLRQRLADQPLGQGPALLYAHQDDRPAAVEMTQVEIESGAHVAVCELARLAGVVLEAELGEQAGLAIAWREQPSHPGERPGVVGQDRVREEAIGLG